MVVVVEIFIGEALIVVARDNEAARAVDVVGVVYTVVTDDKVLDKEGRDSTGDASTVVVAMAADVTT